jgi:hypothetical protein
MNQLSQFQTQKNSLPFQINLFFTTKGFEKGCEKPPPTLFLLGVGGAGSSCCCDAESFAGNF